MFKRLTVQIVRLLLLIVLAVACFTLALNW
jgi:hypothetical protein